MENLIRFEHLIVKYSSLEFGLFRFRFLYLLFCFVCRRGNSIISPTTRSPTTEKIKTTTTELPISINDIEDLLQNVPTTTRRGKATTVRTKSTTTTTVAPDNDDLNFLQQVVSRVLHYTLQPVFVCIKMVCVLCVSMPFSLNVVCLFVCLFRMRLSATYFATSNINPYANSNEIDDDDDDYINCRNNEQRTEAGNLHGIEKQERKQRSDINFR